jgi:hypothetical protein
MTPAFKIGQVVYLRTNRSITGQVTGIMQRQRSVEYEVKLNNLSVELFCDYEITADKKEAVEVDE